VAFSKKNGFMADGKTTIRRTRIAWTLLLLTLPALLLLGCSAQKNYKVLSFFFDGVPDPHAPPTVVAGQTTSNGPMRYIKPRKYLHQPYAEKKCQACHTSDQKQLTSLAAPQLCLQCHANVVNQYSIMHAPVAAAQCLWCHNPHESDQEHLLKSDVADLCLQCHDRQLLSNDNFGHRSEQALCLNCHTGHGSNQPGLLRAQTPDVAPPRSLEPVPAPSGGGMP